MILNCRYHVYGIIIGISDISLKLDALGYISVAECFRISLSTFTQCTPETTEFGEITQNKGYRRSRSFNVTDFGTNRKLPPFGSHYLYFSRIGSLSAEL